MVVKFLKHQIWKYIPFIVLFSFTIEMTLIVTLLLRLPQLLLVFIPVYVANVLLVVKFIKQRNE